MKRIYWIIIIGIVVLAVFISVGVFSGKKPLSIYAEAATTRSIVELVSATGKIQPETELKITSDVSGEITEMLVKEGQEVKKGDLLCRIRPDTYISAKERMNATVNTTRENLKSQQAQLQQAKASLANAEAMYVRNKKLFDQKTISQQEFEAAKAQFEGAKANVESLEAAVKAGQFNIESTEASLREAETTLEKTYIYSPVDATVSKLNVEKGERVVGVQGLSGTEILRLANLNEMEVSVEVNENDIIKVHLGDSALIEVDAYMDKKFKGLVTEIANSSNAVGTTIDQVTNFTVKVRILRESYSDLINARNMIPFRPGMSASVDIQTRRVNKVTAVPIQAVTVRNKDSVKTKKDDDDEFETKVVDEKEEKLKSPEEKAKEYVFLYNNGEASQVEVTTGIQDNEYIEIKSGLKPGDIVITAPYTAISKTLRDKSKVQKVKKEELYNAEK